MGVIDACPMAVSIFVNVDVSQLIRDILEIKQPAGGEKAPLIFQIQNIFCSNSYPGGFGIKTLLKAPGLQSYCSRKSEELQLLRLRLETLHFNANHRIREIIVDFRASSFAL